MRFGPDDAPHRSGPSKKQMEDDLRRAVLSTGGVLVKGARAAAAAPVAKPAGDLRIVKAQPIPPPAAKQAAASLAVRYVTPVEFKGKLKPIQSAAPKLRLADPTVLRIEPEYQRDLSRKSEALIQRIIAEWDWAKFKPPVCAQTAGGLFVIDGQHTAIAAASHPQIKEIPILIVEAAQIERRAAAFVSHNRDRIAMTPAQILHGEAAAGDADARAVLAAVERAGGSVPRLPIAKQSAKPGSISAVGDIRAIHKGYGAAVLERIVRIAVLSRHAPTTLTMLRAIRSVVTGELSKLADGKIAGALASFDNFEKAAQKRADAANQYRFWGGAQLLAERLRAPR